uniref:Bak-2 n=1 Tax=Schmidtea mediterranea TaxID=79327 RepID=H2DL13_SCHMD|nr:bak-2 [Schmidtea mediterranea]
MASGDTNDRIQDDDDENYTVPEQESNTQNFVTQFITSVAQIDIERDKNAQVAQDIINETEPLNNDCCNPIASDLKRIADEIDKSYGTEFENLVTKAITSKIICDAANGYRHFVEITASIFESGITLGRIYVLLMFGYRWIVRSLSVAAETFSVDVNPLQTIIGYLVRFLSSAGVQAFIASIGGWKAIMHSLSSKATIIFAALAGVFVFLAVIFNK